jgi:hypothetical protein
VQKRTGKDKARNAKNSAKFVARTGAQTGGGQGEVQGRLVAIYLSAKTVTFSLLRRIGYELEVHNELELHPLRDFPQCKGLRREPTRKAF